MTSETAKAKAKLAALSASLDDLEAQLEPLFSQPLAETIVGLEPIQQAKLQTAIPYVIYDLVFTYLKARGIDPKTHPVFSELDRIRQYFGKISSAENPEQRTTAIDKAAATRFIKHAIAQAKNTSSSSASTSNPTQLTGPRNDPDDEGVGMEEGEDTHGDNPSRSDVDNSNDEHLDQRQGEDHDEDGDVHMRDSSTKKGKQKEVNQPKSAKSKGKGKAKADTSTPQPKSTPVEPKITSKMIERAEYETQLREEREQGLDDDAEDGDVLEVYDDGDAGGPPNPPGVQEAMDVDTKDITPSTKKKSKSKGKEKAVDTDTAIDATSPNPSKLASVATDTASTTAVATITTALNVGGKRKRAPIDPFAGYGDDLDPPTATTAGPTPSDIQPISSGTPQPKVEADTPQHDPAPSKKKKKGKQKQTEEIIEPEPTVPVQQDPVGEEPEERPESPAEPVKKRRLRTRRKKGQAEEDEEATSDLVQLEDKPTPTKSKAKAKKTKTEKKPKKSKAG